MPKTNTNPSKDFHKAIRALIDNGKFDEIFKSTKTFVESGGTPLPIPFLLSSPMGDKFLPSINSVLAPMLNYLMSLIDEKDFTELTYTSLIKLFTHSDHFNSRLLWIITRR